MGGLLSPTKMNISFVEIVQEGHHLETSPTRGCVEANGSGHDRESTRHCVQVAEKR